MLLLFAGDEQQVFDRVQSYQAREVQGHLLPGDVCVRHRDTHRCSATRHRQGRPGAGTVATRRREVWTRPGDRGTGSEE